MIIYRHGRHRGVPHAWQLLARFLAFAGIGLACLALVQTPITLGLKAAGMEVLVANAIAFLVSACVNYVLQRLITFRGENGRWSTGMIKFVAVSVVSAVVNAGALWLAFYHFRLRDVVAVFAAGIVSSMFSFMISQLLVFGRRSNQPEPVESEAAYVERIAKAVAAEKRPPLADVWPATEGRSLAIFLPSFNEEGNLQKLVAALHKALGELKLGLFKIFVINDGSSDHTGIVADMLANRYDEVIAIHHPKNRGYGGALQTGFRLAAESGCDLWAFMDADGQFDPKSLRTLLWLLVEEDADMAVGIRIGRRHSDSAFRFWLGRAWHFFGSAAVGRSYVRIDDVDCGIKVGWVNKLRQIAHTLSGQGAAISPELIARSEGAGHRIVQGHVVHLARGAGKSTGGNPLVMIRSAISIFRSGIALRLERLAKVVSGANKKGADDVVVYNGDSSSTYSTQR